MKIFKNLMLLSSFLLTSCTINQYYDSGLKDEPFPDPLYVEKMCESYQQTPASDLQDMESMAPPPVQEELTEARIKQMISSESYLLLQYINEERTKRGLSKLQVLAELNCAGQRHANDIGVRKVCTHTGKDGSSFVDRVKKCGYPYARGEIVACGQKTPRAAVDAWLKSSGHYAILSDPLQKYFGAGSKNNYWVVVFSRK